MQNHLNLHHQQQQVSLDARACDSAVLVTDTWLLCTTTDVWHCVLAAAGAGIPAIPCYQPRHSVCGALACIVVTHSWLMCMPTAVWQTNACLLLLVLESEKYQSKDTSAARRFDTAARDCQHVSGCLACPPLCPLLHVHSFICQACSCCGHHCMHLPGLPVSQPRPAAGLTHHRVRGPWWVCHQLTR